jgi:uncharacterized flavoprotein (TIGR03862 family)
VTAGTAKTAAVIGAGPAGLMAAETLASAGIDVTVYDRMPSVGRKLLMAGRGGLNLTHGEPLPRFLDRYGAVASALRHAIEAFPPEALRAWAADLGEETFVGSSGRVFPVTMKASPLLRSWTRRLQSRGVRAALRYRWLGWTESGALRFATPAGPVEVEPDVTVMALGGASWPHLGSDGSWAALLADAGVSVVPFEASNSGVRVDWSPTFRDRFEGQPLKNVAVAIAGASARGDLVVTRSGLEGGPLYALGPSIRRALGEGATPTLTVSLRPDMTREALEVRLKQRRPKQSFATALRKTLHLAPVAVGLLQEARGQGTPPLPDAALAALVNAVPVSVAELSPIARAISTAGGVSFDQLSDAFMLRSRPGVFVAGEMLDWDAPTGGYLLQACFATGRAAAGGAMAWLSARYKPA